MTGREQIFEALLSSLAAADPLGSMVAEAARLSRGSGLVVNELGEVVRAVGSAPGHLISTWVLSDALAGPVAVDRSPGRQGSPRPVRGQIGRWTVSARQMRIRQRVHVFVIAVHDDIGRAPVADAPRARHGSRGPAVDLVLDTVVRMLLAFEGFESFSLSARREESARLMRDLEIGVTPGREPAKWRALEDFGFVAYEAVRIARIRLEAESAYAARSSFAAEGHGSSARRIGAAKGIVVADAGSTSTVIEQTVLFTDGFPLAEFFSDSVIGAGVSEPFTALSQVPEMLRSADVALTTAEPGGFVSVDEMRPVEWAAARMSSRFDRQVAQRFIDRISGSADAWATLSAYLDTGAKIPETARLLQVHENTVRYRLGQIEGVLGARLTDPRTIADIVVALESRRTWN